MATEQNTLGLAQSNTAATPAVAPVNQDVLMLLVQALLAEREEALFEKREKARVREAKENQWRINSQYVEKDVKNRQRLCTHKKGGKIGPKSTKLDYAVYFHTFIDKSVYIRCLICGAKWKPQDTAEFLLRRGKQVENHTGIGWKEAREMLANSTNAPSSSEVMLETAPIEAVPIDFEKNPYAVEV